MSNSSGAPLIKIEKLGVVFNQGKSNEARVIDGLDLEIYPHEYLIFFGPSGCGKSTTLNLISGLLQPTSGKVEINGRDVTSFTEKEKLDYHRKQIGMIFQSFFLVSTLNVLDNVCLPRLFVGDDSPAVKADGMNLLKRFGIEAQAEKFPRDLSGGQRQRVAIARSLMNSPSIIVADEPVGNLDSKATFNVLSILKELNEVDKKLVILVTHDPSHLSYGDRVVHMQDGKITKIVEVFEKKAPTVKGEQEYLEEQSKISKEWEAFKEGKLGKAWDLYKKGELDKDWELVKKKELGSAWETFRQGKEGQNWELGNEYELVRKDELAERKQEHVSPELLTLMRSFRNFSPDQVGTLLIPFKAQQIFSHIFFNIPENQIDLAQKMFQNLIAGGIAMDDFERKLTLEESKGGAGWDAYHARRLTNGIKEILDQVKKIDFSHLEKSANEITEYLGEKFHIKTGEMEKIKFLEYVKMRFGNEIAMDEFLDLIDRPVVKGGIGLDRRKAVKIARELEILMLARYSM